MEPAAFAAELISRLEKLKQEQETMDSLEERLQQIKEVGGGLALLGLGRARCTLLGWGWQRGCVLPTLRAKSTGWNVALVLGEPWGHTLTSCPSLCICFLPVFSFQDEEKESLELPASLQSSREMVNPQHQQHPLSLLPSGSYEEDPQAILDEHLSRVLKTPGCQSPGMGRHSPRARSPDHLLGGKLQPSTASPATCALLGKGFITKQTTKHVHHHYIHHHAVPKTKEQIEAEAAQRVQCCCPAGSDYYCFSKCKGHPKGTDPPLPPLEPFG